MLGSKDSRNKHGVSIIIFKYKHIEYNDYVGFAEFVILFNEFIFQSNFNISLFSVSTYFCPQYFIRHICILE